ncbi:hypothetical protein ACFWBB_07045 [Streptomyces sp. NPDC060000]|uniref:hypothetical protein n=1 Tax=Streptomyces sp. NPDC060000 TaxID=3347031 RepID=UPI0036AEC73B
MPGGEDRAARRVLTVCLAASGLTVSPNRARVLQHVPAEAAGVAGGILRMTRRNAAAVCLSAVSGIYLRSSAVAEGVPRTASR